MRKIWYIKITCLVLLMSVSTITSAISYSSEFPTHYNLWEGSAALHKLEVKGSCNTQISIVSPYEASFDLYAVKNNGSVGACPSNLDIITYPENVSISKRGRASLVLDEGHWCVVVHARTGGGSVYVTADTKCFSSGQNPTINNQPYPYTQYNSQQPSGYL